MMKPMDSVQLHDSGEKTMVAPSQPPAVMRRFALFMDGIARAMILPFGPSLVYRLVYGNAGEIHASTWSGVAYYFAAVVAIYIVGRWLGTVMAHQVSFSQKKLPVYIARLGGAALSLHIFTYGAGLASVSWLLIIRFLSATLAGLLCGITNGLSLPEDDWASKMVQIPDEDQAEPMRRRGAYLDIASGTAKLFLTGFAVSILSGGLLFRKATKDSTFQALTGADQYSLSPLFLIGVAVSAEIILRGLFALAREPDVLDDASNAAGRVRGVVRRIIRDKPQEGKHPSTPQFTDLYEDADHFIDPLRGSKHEGLLSVASPYGRSRMESYASMDDFYDCRSVFSDMETSQTMVQPHADETELTLYVDSKCVYSDGTPSYVPQGDCIGTVPPNYLKFCNGNEPKAEKMWKESQRWRLEKKMWKIHTTPHRWFPRIKDAYPHFVHGFSKAGHAIIYEQPGQMNLKELFRNGCEIADMVRHYSFFMEFISNRLCTRPECRSQMGPDAPQHNSSSWGIIVVMDVRGAGLTHLSGDVVKYLKQAGDINSAHYPMSMKRAFVVNSPFWLAGAWSGIKGILPESVQVDILSESKYPAALREYIDEDQIPPEYGGTSPYSLGEHPFEKELIDLVESLENADDDIEEDSTPPLVILTPSSSDTVENEETDAFSPTVFSSAPSTPTGTQPLRRRLGSVDRVRRSSYNSNNSASHKLHKLGPFGGELDVFTIVSVVHALWSGVQGAIEVAVPLWMLSPPNLGGLGYSPSRSGVSMYCACLVLLWTMRTKSSKLVAQIPSVAPMRAYRIGAGSESALLILLAFVSVFTVPHERSDSVLVMASATIILACMALASMLGRSASKILHRIAAESYVRHTKPQRNWFTNLYGASQLISDCESGRFTTLLTMTGEIIGIFLVAPVWSWSMSNDRPAPFDGTCVLFVSSLLTFVLYVCSFSLHLNTLGEFAPHPKDTCADATGSTRRCLSFLGEVIAVSAGDMASLFEEANWSSTPLLGHSRSRTFSATSGRAERMERGETVRKAK